MFLDNRNMCFILGTFVHQRASFALGRVYVSKFLRVHEHFASATTPSAAVCAHMKIQTYVSSVSDRCFVVSRTK